MFEEVLLGSLNELVPGHAEDGVLEGAGDGPAAGFQQLVRRGLQVLLDKSMDILYFETYTDVALLPSKYI